MEIKEIMWNTPVLNVSCPLFWEVEKEIGKEFKRNSGSSWEFPGSSEKKSGRITDKFSLMVIQQFLLCLIITDITIPTFRLFPYRAVKIVKVAHEATSPL